MTDCSSENTSGFTKEKLHALECAIAEGALEVQYSDKKIVYRSLSEMMKIRDIMKKSLGICSKGKKGLFGGTRLQVETDKDLC